MWSPTFRRRAPLSSQSRLGKRRFSLERLEERTVFSATFDTAVSIGNDAGSTTAADVAADIDGSSYVTGKFSGVVDFDLSAAHPGDADILAARGVADIFVAKYAPDDALVWVKRMGGDETAGVDSGREIAVDASGNVYLTGNFRGSADFGATTLSTSDDNDSFVAKLDASGAFVWAKRWGTSAHDSAFGVDVDSAGNVYALNVRYADALDVVKYSPAGAVLWSKSVATRSASADLTVSATGNVFVVGSFDGIVDFDPSNKAKYVSSGPSAAAFVLKLDAAGKYGWVSPFVGRTVGATTGYSAAQSVTLDGSGNVIVGGYYDNTVDFNPGKATTTLPVTGGGYITKLNSNGGLVWAKSLQSDASTFVYGLDVDSAGAIYATGTFHGQVDLDPGAGSLVRTPDGEADMFIMKLSSAGNLAWAETFGGSGRDVGLGIAVDALGVIHLAGYYADTVDFDPDPLSTYYLTTPTGIFRGFRLRLRQSP
jgi:hypothetical protein